MLDRKAVTTLELFRCQFRNLVHLEALVRAFPALQRLRLEGSSWKTWYDKRVPPPVNLGSLDREQLSGPRLVELVAKTSEPFDDLLAWIATTQSRESIRKLTLHSSKRDSFKDPYDDDFPLPLPQASGMASQFVRMLHPTLEELSIVLPDCLCPGYQGEFPPRHAGFSLHMYRKLPFSTLATCRVQS